jgi:hypothetical protein
MSLFLSGRSCVLAVASFALLGKTANASSWAVSEAEVYESACRPPKELLAGEILWKEIQNLLPDPQQIVSKTIRGVELTDHPRLIEALERLTIDRSYQPEGQVRKSAALPPQCRNVRCVLESPEVFPNQTGLPALEIYLRYNLLASHWVVKNTSSWNLEEIKELHRILQIFPKFLFPLAEPHPLAHFERGYTLGSSEGQLYGNAIIYLFDPWTRASPGTREMVLVHELGHRFAFQKDWGQTERFAKLSLWRPIPEDRLTPLDRTLGKKRFEKGDAKLMVSKYAQTNIDEDFAESIVAYRYAPKKLQTINSEKYAFIKDYIFGGIEYLDSRNCDAPSYSELAAGWLASNTESAIAALIDDTVGRSKLLKECGDVFWNVAFTDGKIPEMDAQVMSPCVTRALGTWAVRNAQVVSADADQELLEAINLRMVPLKLNQENLRNIAKSLAQPTAELIRDFLIASLEHGKWTLAGAKASDPIESTCKTFSLHSYQAAPRSLAERSSVTENFAFRNRDGFSALANRFCLRSLSLQPTLRPGVAEVEAFVDDLRRTNLGVN